MEPCQTYQSFHNLQLDPDAGTSGADGLNVCNLCRRNHNATDNCCNTECNRDPWCTQECTACINNDLAIPLTTTYPVTVHQRPTFGAFLRAHGFEFLFALLVLIPLIAMIVSANK
jgi:hypothetical protein